MSVVLAVIAIVAVSVTVSVLKVPTVIAPAGTEASIQQQKAIRSWKLAIASSSLMFFASLVGFAAPLVPWIAFSFGGGLYGDAARIVGLPSGGYSEVTVIISTAELKGKACYFGSCTQASVANPLVGSAALMIWGAIFQLVGSIQLALIAHRLKQLAHSGAPAAAPCCCHMPAVQGFVWTGWILGGIGAAFAGSVFALFQAALKSIVALEPAPGGVAEAFVVIVGLTACICAAVLNCQITGVTGVGQSTSNCCCGQEAKSDVVGGGPLTVIVNSPIQQAQYPQQYPPAQYPPGQYPPGQQFPPAQYSPAVAYTPFPASPGQPSQPPSQMFIPGGAPQVAVSVKTV